MTHVIEGPLENVKSCTTRKFVLDLGTASVETRSPGTHAAVSRGKTNARLIFNVITDLVGNFIYVHIHAAMI